MIIKRKAPSDAKNVIVVGVDGSDMAAEAVNFVRQHQPAHTPCPAPSDHPTQPTCQTPEIPPCPLAPSPTASVCGCAVPGLEESRRRVYPRPRGRQLDG